MFATGTDRMQCLPTTCVEKEIKPNHNANANANANGESLRLTPQSQYSSAVSCRPDLRCFSDCYFRVVLR